MRRENPPLPSYVIQFSRSTQSHFEIALVSRNGLGQEVGCERARAFWRDETAIAATGRALAFFEVRHEVGLEVLNRRPDRPEA